MGVAGNGITWGGLWSSVVEYVGKEGDAISKLEEKGSGSTSAYTSRQNKKKVRISAKSTTLMFHNLHVKVYIIYYCTCSHARLCMYLLLLKDVTEMVRAFCKYANKSKFFSYSLTLSLSFSLPSEYSILHMCFRRGTSHTGQRGH